MLSAAGSNSTSAPEFWNFGLNSQMVCAGQFPLSLQGFGNFHPSILQLGNAAFEVAQLLGEPGDADVVGLIMVGQFTVFGRDLVSQPGQQLIDGTELLFGGAQ